MNVRDLKLSVATGIETDEIKSLNVFFDNLFSDLSVFIDVDDDETDLIFMKGDDCIMNEKETFLKRKEMNSSSLTACRRSLTEGIA